jgi:hypothetical protein
MSKIPYQQMTSNQPTNKLFEISSSHGGEYDVGP